jgi:hypothetical protein
VKLSDLGIARRLGDDNSSSSNSNVRHAPSKSADAVMDRAHVASSLVLSSGKLLTANIIISMQKLLLCLTLQLA